ncbi:hypothetical protein [Rhodocaloribacter sp.]
MNARTKSALILLVTLAVGILIGSLATSAVINHRIEQLAELRRPTGFSLMLERVIRPQDETQREQIRAILEEAGARMAELRRSHFSELKSIIDSTRARLDPILTPEQKQRLEAWFSRDRKRLKTNRWRRRPGGARLRPPGPAPDSLPER